MIRFYISTAIFLNEWLGSLNDFYLRDIWYVAIELLRGVFRLLNDVYEQECLWKSEK